MAVQDRIKRYRKDGGAADLVRVEVLVPASGRAAILLKAREVRDEHRRRKGRLQPLLDKVLDRYRLRILDNIDLERLPDIEDRARVVAHALIERGDARAFSMGRQILAALGR